MSDEEMNKGKPPSPEAQGDHSSSNFSAWWGSDDLSWFFLKGPNDIDLDPVQDKKWQTLLLTHGDYAGRLWNCLVQISRAKDMRSLNSRVAPFRDKLNQESLDPFG